MSLCFCPSCLNSARSAGIDADKLREEIAARIREEFEKPALPPDPHDLPGIIPSLDAFIDWRINEITGLIKSIKRESRPDGELITIATVFPPNANARLINGADPRELEHACDTVAVSGYFSSPR